MRGRTKKCDDAEDEDGVVKCGAHNFSSCEKKMWVGWQRYKEFMLNAAGMWKKCKICG